jgi:hypothetical protein
VCTQVEAVFAEHADTLPEKRYLESALESISASLKWLEENAGPACAWLEMETAR